MHPMYTQGVSQVSTYVAVDHQTYSALAQQIQITWTAQLKCDKFHSEFLDSLSSFSVGQKSGTNDANDSKKED